MKKNHFLKKFSLDGKTTFFQKNRKNKYPKNRIIRFKKMRKNKKLNNEKKKNY